MIKNFFLHNLVRRGSFKYAFETEHDDTIGDPVIKSGKNCFLLRTIAGPIGIYTLQQISIRIFDKRLDFLAEMSDSSFFPLGANETNRYKFLNWL